MNEGQINFISYLYKKDTFSNYSLIHHRSLLSYENFVGEICLLKIFLTLIRFGKSTLHPKT